MGRGLLNEAASNATELAPELAFGNLALGMGWKIGLPNGQPTLAALGTALRLNPGNAEVLIEWARINLNLGHWDNAVSAARKALAMEPISVYVNHLMGHIFYFARHYEEAIVALERTLELNPDFPKPRYFMAMAHHWMGNSETAWEVIQEEPLEWMRLCASAVILHKLGRTDEAGDALARLVEMGLEETNYIQQADVYAQMGDHDQAIQCLDKAVEMRDPGLTQLLVDPFLDPIRKIPRFNEIFAKAGFEPT